jgi:chromosome partitioning protein
MNTTLVINPKGGSGKTTLAINLASYFAATNVATAIMDYDPQGSSLNWLRSRAPQAMRIHGANAAPGRGSRLRSFEMYVPPETRQLIIDAPAGASGAVVQQMLDRAHCIIVPVVPSVIDLHAAETFVKQLLATRWVRESYSRLAVVANKVRRSMPVYQPLERFLNSLNLKLLARLIDSDLYLKAAETGLGIFEIDPALSVAERKQFMPIAEWVDRRHAAPAAAANSEGVASGEGVVYELARSRLA